MFLDIHYSNALTLHDRLFPWPMPLAEASETVRLALPQQAETAVFSIAENRSFELLWEQRHCLPSNETVTA